MSAPRAAPPAALAKLSSSWRARVEGPARQAVAAGLLATGVGVAHLARLGTAAARGSAALALALCSAAWLFGEIRSRRSALRPETIVRQTIAPLDPSLADRTLRALRLCDRTAADGAAGSPELALLHLTRVLGRTDPDRVAERAERKGHALRRAALATALLLGAALLLAPMRVAEGLDVLVARQGYAPVPLRWIAEPTLSVTPPEYLHESVRTLEAISSLEAPHGSILTVRGEPVRSGRRLVVVDGEREVPFVDDAEGGIVARLSVEKTAQVRIAARFGSVLIPEDRAIAVQSIPDDAPTVTLEGAPRTTKLLDEPEIVLRYDATDDHGMREVDLVLRTGEREDRRVLSRLDGEARRDRGAYRLRAQDPFFKRAYAPVEVRIEARDNDPLGGPKWGKSASMTVIPPQVGEPEALRYEAWKRLRDAAVDVSALRIEGDDGLAFGAPPGPSPWKSAQGRRSHLASEQDQAEQLSAEIERTLGTSFGGQRAPRAADLLARSQQEKLARAMRAEQRAPSASTHAENRKVTEDAALTLDAALRRLDVHDAAAVARRLADVADDAAHAATQAAGGGETDQGRSRFAAALSVLDGGGAGLRRLGALGKDLGEIVANDLKRVRRADGQGDPPHVELALQDLAARLRRPSPSFGAGRSGGTESGGSPRESQGSDGAQEIAREQELLEELSRDHAAELGGVEQALNRTGDDQQADAERRAAREHAQAIRNAVRDLPLSGGEPGTSESSASEAREHAQAMADELERGQPSDAVRSGRSALDALGLATRSPRSRYAFNLGENTRESARAAESKLTPEVRWAEKALEEIRRAASARAADELHRSADREQKLSERARQLAERGSSAAGTLPEPMVGLLEDAQSAMREASRALGEANGDRGLERQREAQRLLDMARSGDESESEGERGEDERRQQGSTKDGSSDFGHAAIPGASDHAGPDAFRKRVLQGLGGFADPRLGEAVKRYAQGLLR